MIAAIHFIHEESGRWTKAVAMPPDAVRLFSVEEDAVIVMTRNHLDVPRIQLHPIEARPEGE